MKAESIDKFHQILFQKYSWLEDENLGGMVGTLKRMREADPYYGKGLFMLPEYKC